MREMINSPLDTLEIDIISELDSNYEKIKKSQETSLKELTTAQIDLSYIKENISRLKSVLNRTLKRL